ncbi:MAG: 3-hydroxyacyl-CoA dehydrogenase family protein [Gammaproteobacteria bacterium]|nr:3-hydroxyacyl-CoA dehydrogenase family protein [Gammaproteobacteria bacterium]MYF61507.1 3-hydroxyacyl-CoA dehydrogenase family protein [Gammaproteobacteria bacterium]MYI22243.1 3-hydroxyacyl-CoA dehydrogenase family protein [Gammaproteobacteria bacterium]
MGHGIAQVAAMAGHRVTLHDPDAGAADRGLARIRANLAKGVSLGKVSEEGRTAALDRIALASSLATACAEADLVVEAAPERMELKRSLFREVEAAAAPSALLATNTSSLSIDAIAEVLADPGRFLGLHFFNPVHLMALVEVVRGSRTGDATLDAGVAFARGLGKEPIVVRDAPGFASSRLGVALGLEAMRMVEEGVADPAAIDKAMELGYRHPMGPLRLTDLVGLDVRLAIAEYLHEKLGGERYRPPAILRRMVEEGKLGRKTGQGFYRWDKGGD